MRKGSALAFLAGLGLVLGGAFAQGGLATLTDQATVPANTFTTAACYSTWCLQNDPTPPTGDTTSQAVLPLAQTPLTATTLYNYDTDRDTEAGITILSGGSGASESDPTKHQAWRTAALGSALTIDGTVTVTLWGAMKNFGLNKQGSVTLFLRDYDGASHTEICQGALTEADWQAGSGTWVMKTISFGCSSYTIAAGDQLEVKLIVNSAAEDAMWFAYDTTSYDSRVELP